MGGARIALLAADGPLPGLLEAEINRRRPGLARRFDLTLTGGRFALDADSIQVDGVDLGGFDTVWTHGFSYENPIIPDAGLHRDWSVWQIGYLADQQTYSSRFSLLRELQRRGVRVVNPVDLHIESFVRFGLLERLRALGLPIPPLLCCNQVAAAEAFCREHEAVLWRPVTGRASWQFFEEKQKTAHVAPDKPPVLLSPALPGHLLRVWLVAGKVVLCLKHRHPDAAPYQEALERFWAVPCPEAVRAPVERMAAALGLYWGSVLLVEGADGPWIYDLDTDPLIDWLPIPHRDHLVQALAAGLAGDVVPVAASGTSEPDIHERSGLFLRRMLRILFQFEASKRERGGG